MAKKKRDPQLDIDFARGDAGRDRALDRFETNPLVAQLRNAAWAVWHRTHQPVSVNDVRYVLAEAAYDGDPRILGATFHHAEWKKIGYDKTNSLLANTRPIGLFMPREES